jgi:hypothetical protein
MRKSLLGRTIVSVIEVVNRSAGFSAAIQAATVCAGTVRMTSESTFMSNTIMGQGVRKRMSWR